MKTENGIPATTAEAEFHKLRQAYDAAFRRYAIAVENGRCIEESKQAVNEQRDSLVRFMIRMGKARKRNSAIAQLAYSLWEKSGRPEGSAESDWRKAECLFEKCA